MEKLSLNGTWQLTQSGKDDPIPAIVPGCVHTALLNNNLLDDPFYRDNEVRQMWVGETDWTYSRAFTVSETLLTHDRVLLRCHGLDTIATLTLNDTSIGTTENMFRTYEFDVKSLLKAGENNLTIEFAAPSEYVRRMDAEKGELAAWVTGMRTNSGAWIRKEPCNFGWDWGPMMITSGIWRDIELVAFDTARISDVAITQEHSPGHVQLTVAITTERLNDTRLTAIVTITQDGAPISATDVLFDEDNVTLDIDIPEPELWWPNGMGEQPLYDVTVTLKKDGHALDTLTKSVGLRTLTLERHDDQWGESFYFACNGVPFFAKGANWIPASPYPGSTTAQDYRMLVQAAVDANMNMLRVWGGGIYEDEAFYAACDELGITIWQDFIFACGTYPAYDDDFMENVRVEAEQNVRRIRHHACIALWCGNNELEQGMPSDEWKASMSWDDYSRLFDDLLANIVHELAPQTAYWPGSPHSPCGDRENWENQSCGDTHLWAVWHGKEPFEWYRSRNDRFCSEFGFQSWPEPQTVYDFTAPEDRNITSYVMEHHQRSGIGNSTIIHYMLSWFRLPTSFESTIWLSQILQGMAMKYAVEHWRRNMPRTMGTLYWQHNDMWPAPSWSSLDWKGNWKALHYMAKRFYAPVLLSGVEDASTNTVEMHITSDRLTEDTGTLFWRITDLNGSTLLEGDKDVTIPANSSTCAHSLDLSPLVAEQTQRGILTWLRLVSNGEVISTDLVLLSRPKHLELAQPDIAVTVEEAATGTYTVSLTSTVPALYVWLTLPDARFSDNFFHLQPNTAHTVTVTTQNIKALKIESLADTYQ